MRLADASPQLIDRLISSLRQPGNSAFPSLPRTHWWKREVPVVGVAVIEDFEVAWSGVFGGAPDAVFQAGSIAKSVAALVALQAALAGRSSPVLAETAALMLTPHARLPAKGDWRMLRWLGVQPPDTDGLGMFLGADARFLHVGRASSFAAALTASRTDGSGGVVMMASNTSRLLFEVLLSLDKTQGWTGFRLP